MLIILAIYFQNNNYNNNKCVFLKFSENYEKYFFFNFKNSQIIALNYKTH